MSKGLLLLTFLTACAPARRSGPPGAAAPVAPEAVQRLAAGFALDGGQADEDLAQLTAAGHPFGSPRQAAMTAWLQDRLGKLGLGASLEPFTAVVPNPGYQAYAANDGAGPDPGAETLVKQGANVYGYATGQSASCAVLIASHYDTKVVAGTDYLGANDSGSSTAVLLQLLAYLKTADAKSQGLACDVVGAFMDGEEAVLWNWNDGEQLFPAKILDHTYGSRFAVSRLGDCDFAGKPAKCLPQDLGGQPLRAFVLLDMVGSPALRLSRDANSAPALVDLARAAATATGAPTALDQGAVAMDDDHLPYAESGVPAVDLIDFDHLAYWHKAGDDPATLAHASLELAGRIALYIAGTAASPD